MGKRIGDDEAAFTELLVPVCRVRDLAVALGRASSRGLQRVMAKRGIRGRRRGETQPLALEAVKEAWRRYRAGLPISSNLRYWSQETGGLQRQSPPRVDAGR